MGMPYSPGDAMQINSIAPSSHFEIYSEIKHGKRWREAGDDNIHESLGWDPFKKIKKL